MLNIWTDMNYSGIINVKNDIEKSTRMKGFNEMISFSLLIGIIASISLLLGIGIFFHNFLKASF